MAAGAFFLLMRSNQASDIQGWVEEYAEARIASIPESDRLPMILKRAHTLRVAEDARAIAQELGWSDTDIFLAETIALLHDIARFEQYIQFRTFLDATSFDHGERGRQIASTCSCLSPLASAEREVILTAIALHNKKDIPGEIRGQTLRQLHLIRDADKIDILYSISLILRESWHLKHPGILLDIDFEGPLNPDLVDEMLRTKTGSYENVRTLMDIHLMRIGWVHSVVYTPALRRIAERMLYESSEQLLPDTPEVRTIRERASSYVEGRLRSSG